MDIFDLDIGVIQNVPVIWNSRKRKLQPQAWVWAETQMNCERVCQVLDINALLAIVFLRSCLTFGKRSDLCSQNRVT